MNEFYIFIEKFFAPAVIPIIVVLLSHYLQNRKIETVTLDVEKIKVNTFQTAMREIYGILKENTHDIENEQFSIVQENSSAKGYKYLLEHKNYNIKIWLHSWGNLFIQFPENAENNIIGQTILKNKNWSITTNTNKWIYNTTDESLFNKTPNEIYKNIRQYMKLINQ